MESVTETAVAPTTWKTVRYETKYQLDAGTYQRVKASLAGRAFADDYSRRAPEGRYLVRSLYFDTHNLQAYQENLVGQGNRIKLRLRTYDDTPSADAAIKMEIKCRYAAVVGKFSALVNPQDCEQFLQRQQWPGQTGAVADEFRRLVLLRGLRPKVLVDYRREAWVPYDRRDIRITFDHHLKFASARELFPSSVRSYTPHSKIVVLEIKSDGDIPRWLDLLVKQHSLKSVPNSKYARAVEQTQVGIFRRW